MDMHANGILGIDVGLPDPEGSYFACQANACTQFTPPAAQRVANPVLALPADNNGVIINLPGIPDDGQATVYGTLVLGNQHDLEQRSENVLAQWGLPGQIEQQRSGRRFDHSR